jgi:hypothetical protein
MSRRKSQKAREARRLRAAEKRKEEAAEAVKFYNKFGIHPKAASPRRLAQAELQRKRFQRRQREAAATLRTVLDKAKLLAVVPEEFEYCNLAPTTKESVEAFAAEMKAHLAKYEGTDTPNAVVDDEVRDFMQSRIDMGVLKAAPPRAGSVPKARVFKSGRLAMLRRGEPDYDYMLEQLGQE